MIVGGFATAHILMKRGSAGEAGERAFEGMQNLSTRVRALKPDLVVILGSEHFYNLKGTDKNLYFIGTEESYQTYGDMDLPVRTLPCASAVSSAVLSDLQDKKLPVAQLPRDYRPDHGLTLPYFMLGEPELEVLPIIVNLLAAEEDTPATAWKLGSAIRETLEKVSANKRVVVMGTGGLSHWLGVPEMGRVNSDWDNDMIESFISGNAEKLSNLVSSEIVAEGGNGGLEVSNWIAMAAMLPGAKGEKVYYEPVSKWMTGMGGIEIFAEEER